MAKGKPPTLTVAPTLKFKVKVHKHDYKSPEHISKVKKFLAGTEEPGTLFESLKIQTEQAQKRVPVDPSSSPVFPKKMIGQGSFSVVNYVYDLIRRVDFVEKTPSPHGQGYNESIWRKEAKLMGKISHVRINISLSFVFMVLMANS